MHKFLRTLVLIAAVLCTAAPAVAATPAEFYASLLRRGVAAYDGARFDEALRQLRIAAFGLVDSVEHYETAQTYLALTYSRLGDTVRAREAVRRVAIADRNQRKFATLDLPAPVRTAFLTLATNTLSPSELATLRTPPVAATPAPQTSTATGAPNPAKPTSPAPAVVNGVVVEEVRKPATPTTTATTPPQQATTGTTPQRPATTTTTNPQQATANPPATTTATPQQSASTTPQNSPTPTRTTPPTTTSVTPPGPAATQPQSTSTNRPPVQTQPSTVQTQPATPPRSSTATTTTTTTTTEPAPARRPAPTLTPSEVASRLGNAERALNAANLVEARRLYREILAASGTERATILRVAEGLYRARDFSGALAAFERLGTLRRGEEPYRYYVAVALYETAQYARARSELAAVLPYIEITPDVARYRAKIEGAVY